MYEMHTTTIAQGSILLKRTEITVEKKGLAVRERDLLKSIQFHVPYESIPFRLRCYIQSSQAAFGVATILTLFALIALGWVLATKNWRNEWLAVAIWVAVAASFWLWFSCSKKEILIFEQDVSGIAINANKPSRAAAESFVKTMLESRNAYLKARYARFANEEAIPQRLAKLNYLLTQEAISEAEFEELSNNCGQGVTAAPGPVGFAPA